MRPLDTSSDRFHFFAILHISSGPIRSTLPNPHQQDQTANVGQRTQDRRRERTRFQSWLEEEREDCWEKFGGTEHKFGSELLRILGKWNEE